MTCKECKYYLPCDDKKFFKCSWKPGYHNYMPPCQIELLLEECDDKDDAEEYYDESDND